MSDKTFFAFMSWFATIAIGFAILFHALIESYVPKPLWYVFAFFGMINTLMLFVDGHKRK